MTTMTHQYTEIARQARRQGYEAASRYDVFVHCPQCRAEVHADPQTIGGRAGDSTVAFPALDAAMLTHLAGCV